MRTKRFTGCGVKTLEPCVENYILLYDNFAYVLRLAMLKS
ncbi:hypothetical protein HMPREF1982_02740 [Clostridiales bacterium oral taxon 876 str. F0540]|nr:hypothetical protein HMPREF1982_02740 [Clostridiales bacterium oral taxon 876 str. F0540]